MKHWIPGLMLLIVLAGCLEESVVKLIPEGTEVGQLAPDFSLQTPDGETVTLSQYRGSQHVVLVFHTGRL